MKSIVQRVDMTAEQKRVFILEIKEEFKEMVNSICIDHITPLGKKLIHKIDTGDK